MAGESFSIPSFDFDPYFCFPLSPVMENELCGCGTMFLDYDVIPLLESPGSSAAPGISVR